MATSDSEALQSTNPALQPDMDAPFQPGLELAQFAAGCFWGVELAFQRIEGVVKTEVGYSQGHVHNPNYKLVCTGFTNHAEVIRVHFDPNVCPYSNLLALFWSRHNPTTLNRQGGDVGTQYRSGIYYYSETQAQLARESLEEKQFPLHLTLTALDLIRFGLVVDCPAGENGIPHLLLLSLFSCQQPNNPPSPIIIPYFID